MTSTFNLRKTSQTSYKSILSDLLDYKLIDMLLFYLTEESFSNHSAIFNLALANIFKQIVSSFGRHPKWIFFQISYLDVLSDFVGMDNIILKKMEAFKILEKAIDQIFASYCQMWEKNPLLPMESLYKIKNGERLELIMGNYSGNISFFLYKSF